MQVTYSIRIDHHDPETIWIDQLADSKLDRSFGPYWSVYQATKQIKAWEAGSLWGRHWPQS